MGRKTIRIEVRTNRPDDFSKLLNNIKKEDDSLGANSVLKADSDIDMNDFAQKLSEADALREQSENLKAQSETLMQQAKNIYGTAMGQSINTQGTLYFMLDTIKKILLKKYKGNEERLSIYGFNVVIGQSKNPIKRRE